MRSAAAPTASPATDWLLEETDRGGSWFSWWLATSCAHVGCLGTSYPGGNHRNGIWEAVIPDVVRDPKRRPSTKGRAVGMGG
jgi:hypothetical protein